MGNKVSAVTGVRSPNFFEPGNAVNEVWVGDLEVISRLPFGDSDMAQAGWPKNDYPKIPWRPFIIPLRATFSAAMRLESLPSIADPDLGWIASLRGFADKKLLHICWVAMKILAIPMMMVPIVFHLVLQDHLTAYGDDEDESPDRTLPLADDEAVPPQSPPPRRRRNAVYTRALLGSVFHITGVLLGYAFDHGSLLKFIRIHEPSLEHTGSGVSFLQYFAGPDTSTVYAAMSIVLFLNSAYSVFRLLCAYYQFQQIDDNQVRQDNMKDTTVISLPPLWMRI
ncbi:conserved hypothetical protein [Histoplasma capsulatum var. duboisii H88]|uniref:Uncharacterized protein n=1 Tax=Ajellomyces capsulatus (strain H88) TaxID=544711 RepID=F0UUX0_AJEC8|nr:conserved hypothetical protein [Histoplasma capsulatum var. duboisii H88]QSS57469.1 hypothetical protein I7I53_11660 [Histoplasma capsulatum var. duboisii H88]